MVIQVNNVEINKELLKEHFYSKKNSKARKWFLETFFEEEKDMYHNEYIKFMYKMKEHYDLF